MAAQAKKKTAKPSEQKKSRTSNAKKKQPSTQQRTGRGTAAAIIILLVLSVLLLIGFFASNAAVLGPICDGIKYLLGAGFYVLPFVLIVLALHLLIHFRKRKNILRCVVICLIPFWVGAILHVFLTNAPYATLRELLDASLTCRSGGLIAGGFADLLIRALTRVGAAVVIVLLFLMDILYMLNFRLTQLAEMLGERLERVQDQNTEQRAYRRAERNRQRLIRQEARDRERAEAAEKEAQLRAAAEAASRQKIDIPLETKRRIDIPLDGYASAPSGAFAPPPHHDGEPKQTFSAPEALTHETKAPETVSANPEPAPIPVREPEPAQNPIPIDPEPIQQTEKQTPFMPEIRGVAPPKVDPVVFQPVQPQPTAKERLKTEMSPDELEAEIAQVGAAAEQPVCREYTLPPIELLKSEPPTNQESAEAEMRQNADKLLHTLTSFNIDAQIVAVTRGPTVTRYEVQLSSGTRSSRLTALADDIALALAAQSIRIAPVPNKSAIGIEVPNKIVTTVYLRDVLESREFKESRSRVTFALGKDIAGNPIVSDIARLPHMLVGGTTNSGKSVCINSLLISLIYKSTPEEVRLILIDPKMVEFASYNGIPHLLIPVVTDAKKAAGALQWAVMEMMQRYKQFNELGVRNFTEYNDECDRLNAAAEAEAEAMAEASAAVDTAPFALSDEEEAAGEPVQQTQQTPQTPPEPPKPRFEKMARIVIVIDELADLMIVSPGEVEESICRIAQMARAAGMHLIVATQRPSADVVTGLMKANIPSRIAFSVASGIESRIILDQIGAERLIGRGDMLFAPIGANKPTRIQGCLVTSPEIDAVVEYVKSENTASYSDEVIAQIDKNAQNAGNGKGKGRGAAHAEESGGSDDVDELFNDAVSIAVESGRVSTSMLQTRLKLGYARAARIVDQMESCGIIGPFEGQKPRQILISKEDWAEMRYRREGRED